MYTCMYLYYYKLLQSRHGSSMAAKQSEHDKFLNYHIYAAKCIKYRKYIEFSSNEQNTKYKNILNQVFQIYISRSFDLPRESEIGFTVKMKLDSLI